MLLRLYLILNVFLFILFIFVFLSFFLICVSIKLYEELDGFLNLIVIFLNFFFFLGIDIKKYFLIRFVSGKICFGLKFFCKIFIFFIF